MSERYTKVFSLPENLYTTGAPVAVSAGALLKDNQTGKVLAQLKLTNIQYKKIKAVKVKLFPQDTMGQPLGDAVEYQYLDLQIARDADFGSKTPILFPDATTRSFAVEVTTVVFADNTAWYSDGTFWEPIPNRVALHQKYDNLVIEQLRLEQSGTCQFVVQEYKDLWLCTCGAVNHDGEVRCHNCGKQLSQIHPLDAAGLTERANARLAEEARLVAEEKAAKATVAEASKKETAMILKIAIPVVCAIIAVTLLTTKVIIPNSKYNKAVSLMEAGQYEDAITEFESMDGYKDSAAQITSCENAIIEAEVAAKFAYAEELLADGNYDDAIAVYETLADYESSAEGIATAEEGKLAVSYQAAEKLAEHGETAKAAIAFGKLGDYSDSHMRSWELWSECAVRETISAGEHHTVGLCNDGSVVAVGSHHDDRCDTDNWKDIIAVKAGGFHTVGLREDGTVVAVGNRGEGRCDTEHWKDIVAVDAGRYHTVGLRTDGTVVAVGFNESGQCHTRHWEDIIAVCGGGWHTVGLRSDGTVVAVGENKNGQCDTDSWRDIVAISAGPNHTVGLRRDGTVVAVGSDAKENYAESRCDTDDWRDIIAISAGASHTVGLHSDGTVVAVGPDKYKQCDTDNWSDIIAITTKGWHTIGLRSDGTVVTIGFNESGQCDIKHWDNIKLPK